LECRILCAIPLKRQAFPKLAAIVQVEDQQFVEQVRPFVKGNPNQEFIDSRAIAHLPGGLELVANTISPQAARQADRRSIIVPLWFHNDLIRSVCVRKLWDDSGLCRSQANSRIGYWNRMESPGAAMRG